MEKKEKVLKVKLNEKQYQILENLIKKTGLTKSEIVRYLLVFQSQNIPDGKKVRELQEELARIGSNLNQIARGINILVKENKENKNKEKILQFIKQTLKNVYELQNKIESYKK